MRLPVEILPWERTRVCVRVPHNAAGLDTAASSSTRQEPPATPRCENISHLPNLAKIGRFRCLPVLQLSLKTARHVLRIFILGAAISIQIFEFAAVDLVRIYIWYISSQNGLNSHLASAHVNVYRE
jgi:hypothetical protein